MVDSMIWRDGGGSSLKEGLDYGLDSGPSVPTLGFCGQGGAEIQSPVMEDFLQLRVEL